MDPYQDMMRKKRRRSGIQKTIVTAVVLVVLIAAACYAAVRYGGFSVTVTLNGDQDVLLRYGDLYSDPGAAAVFQGKYVVKNPVELPVTVTGDFSIEKVGAYELTYSAGFGFWHAKAQRSIRVVDRVKPKIILSSSPAAYVRPGEVYQEEGYIARDNYDGDVTDQVQITRYHNRIVYSVADSSGNRAEVERKIVCYDPIYPEINLEGEQEMILNLGFPYVDPGFTALDNLDGDLTDRVTVKGKVDVNHAGTYRIRYSVSDSYGNRTSVCRTVNVVSPVQPDILVPEGKVIYLTFDDGPGPYTRELLEVLRKYDVKATFFVVKTKYLELLKEIAADGHAIGIHSVSHDYDEIYSGEEAYFEDLYEMQRIIAEHTGITTSLVRFPGGSSNTVSKFNKGIMTRLTELLHERGFQYFDWNVNSGDAGDTTKTKEVVKFILNGIEEYDVSIVLQHDIKKYSVEAVEEVILWALKNGYRFLPLEPNSPNAHHKVRN